MCSSVMPNIEPHCGTWARVLVRKVRKQIFMQGQVSAVRYLESPSRSLCTDSVGTESIDVKMLAAGNPRFRDIPLQVPLFGFSRDSTLHHNIRLGRYS